MISIWTKEEEVEHLQRRFNDLKSEKKISQARFAREHGMPGGASMITQHLKSTRPISLEHALVYARGFECQLAEISPRLAKLVAEGQATSNSALIDIDQPKSNQGLDRADSAWPFELVDRDRYEALSDAQRHKAQVRMMDEIIELERQGFKANGTHNR